MRTYLLTQARQIIGRAGESGEVAIAIKIKDWLTQWPEATAGLLCIRPNLKRIPVSCAVEDQLLVAEIPEECTRQPGIYRYTATWTQNGTVQASATYECVLLGSGIDRGIPETGPRTPDWAKEIFIKADSIQRSADGILQGLEEVAGAVESTGNNAAAAAASAAAAQAIAGQISDAAATAQTQAQAAEGAAQRAEAAAQGVSDDVTEIAGTASQLRNMLNTAQGYSDGAAAQEALVRGYAEQASGSAAAAAQSAQAAAGHAVGMETYVQQTADNALDAETSRIAADQAASRAEVSTQNAYQSELHAAASANQALTASNLAQNAAGMSTQSESNVQVLAAQVQASHEAIGDVEDYYTYLVGANRVTTQGMVNLPISRGEIFICDNVAYEWTAADKDGSGQYAFQSGEVQVMYGMLQELAAHFKPTGRFQAGTGTASADYANAEGQDTQARGESSHAEGYLSITDGEAAHAEGYMAGASGDYAHAAGECTVASRKSQTVFGRYNEAEQSSAALGKEYGSYVEIVGNGDEDTRSNARTLDWNGNEKLAGGLTLGMGTADEAELSAARLGQLTAGPQPFGPTSQQLVTHGDFTVKQRGRVISVLKNTATGSGLTYDPVNCFVYNDTEYEEAVAGRAKFRLVEGRIYQLTMVMYGYVYDASGNIDTVVSHQPLLQLKSSGGTSLCQVRPAVDANESTASGKAAFFCSSTDEGAYLILDLSGNVKHNHQLLLCLEDVTGTADGMDASVNSWFNYIS